MRSSISISVTLFSRPQAVIGNQEVTFEALVAEQRNADAAIERFRDGHHDLSERFNLVQGRFYSVGGDIARVEGPERIAPEWWRERSSARLRDYYRVEDNHGRRYWIYREGVIGDGRGGAPEWYLHGLFG